MVAAAAAVVVENKKKTEFPSKSHFDKKRVARDDHVAGPRVSARYTHTHTHTMTMMIEKRFPVLVVKSLSHLIRPARVRISTTPPLAARRPLHLSRFRRSHADRFYFLHVVRKNKTTTTHSRRHNTVGFFFFLKKNAKTRFVPSDDLYRGGTQPRELRRREVTTFLFIVHRARACVCVCTRLDAANIETRVQTQAAAGGWSDPFSSTVSHTYTCAHHE